VLTLILTYTSNQLDEQIDVQRKDDLITSHSTGDGRRIIYQSIVVTDGNIECRGRDRKDRQKNEEKSRDIHDAQHTLNDWGSTRL
jgi:hypothetical protein